MNETSITNVRTKTTHHRWAGDLPIDNIDGAVLYLINTNGTCCLVKAFHRPSFILCQIQILSESTSPDY